MKKKKRTEKGRKNTLKFLFDQQSQDLKGITFSLFLISRTSINNPLCDNALSPRALVYHKRSLVSVDQCTQKLG